MILLLITIYNSTRKRCLMSEKNMIKQARQAARLVTMLVKIKILYCCITRKLWCWLFMGT